MRQIGISPKLIADLLVSVAAFLVAYPVFGLDPVAAAAVGKALGSVAAFVTSPGVVQFYEPAPIDDPDGEAGSIDVVDALILVLVVLVILVLVDRL